MYVALTLDWFTRRLQTNETIRKQREIESSSDVDVDDIDLEISSNMVSENVWRTKKSKLAQHNTNAADEIFTAV